MTDSRPTSVPELEMHLRASIHDALRGIPRIGGIHLSCGSYTRMFTVNFGFDGWSPTLHGIRVRRSESLHLRQEAIDEAATYFGRTFDKIATLQKQRVTDAAALGFDRPLHTREIEHLDIDTALMALRGDGAEGTRSAVLDAIRRAHAVTVDYAGGASLLAGGVLLGDSLDGESGRWLRICAPNIKLRGPDGLRATLRAFELEMNGEHLAGSALSEFEGRPLRDLAPVHPLIDDRIVRKVTNRTWKDRPGLIVKLDMSVDRIDTVLRGDAPTIPAAA